MSVSIGSFCSEYILSEPIKSMRKFKPEIPKLQVKLCSILLLVIIFQYLASRSSLGQLQKKRKADDVVAEMQVVCNSDSIVLKLNTNNPFDGMIYAKDAPNGIDCIKDFKSSTNMVFKLPLKSCNTMFAEVDDGIEYFNTVMVQPHMRLMTHQGKGYHIRCKYQTRERTIANTHFNVSASFPMQNGPQAAATPLLATASMPSCTMKIFRSGRDDVAETVKIGDKLIMVIEIDQQDMYGMKVTNCLVRDGLNRAEQLLINESGCPVDELIMPKFQYSNNSTRATVAFPAHKFPHTSSIYYQCNVRLCINNGGCDLPECSSTGAPAAVIGPSNSSRRKRFVDHEHSHRSVKQFDNNTYNGLSPVASMPAAEALKSTKDDMSFDVYSGLYVKDADLTESGSSDINAQLVSPPTSAREDVCLTIGKVTIIICMASLASIGIVLAFLFQIGILGRNKQLRPSPISVPSSTDYHIERPSGGNYIRKGNYICRH